MTCFSVEHFTNVVQGISSAHPLVFQHQSWCGLSVFPKVSCQKNSLMSGIVQAEILQRCVFWFKGNLKEQSNTVKMREEEGT